MLATIDDYMIHSHFFISILICFFLLSLNVTYPACAAPDHSYDEWREILAIGDEIDPHIGAKLTLMITPSLHYQEVGSEISVSGSLRGVFGPFQNTGIILKQWNNTGSEIDHEIFTDNEGNFNITKILPEEGSLKFQAYLPSSDAKFDTSLTSEQLEVKCSLFPDGFEVLSFESQDNVSTIAEGNSNTTINNSTIVTLSVNPSMYVPGHPVQFSGFLSDKKGKSIPYTRLLLHMDTIKENNYSGGIIEGFTNATGNFAYNLSLAGPYSVSCALENPGKGKNYSLWSQKITLHPISAGINPPAKTIREDESIDLFINNGTVSSLQNITVFGWFNGKDRNKSSFQILEFVWYNFGDKNWDSYQNSSDILTNEDGKFEYTVSAPQTPGMYIIGIRRAGNTTQIPLYSNVQAITVVTEEKEEINQVQFPIINISVPQSNIRVSDSVTISLDLKNKDNTPVPDTPVSLLYSENSIEWIILPASDMSTDQKGHADIIVKPGRKGFHYYRAIIGNNSVSTVSSAVLVIPVLSTNEQEYESRSST